MTNYKLKFAKLLNKVLSFVVDTIEFCIKNTALLLLINMVWAILCGTTFTVCAATIGELFTYSLIASVLIDSLFAIYDFLFAIYDFIVRCWNRITKSSPVLAN